MGDLTEKHLKPHPNTKKCAYCGELNKELVVIMNPNKFPANNVKGNRKDTWTVCEDCRDVINMQMDESMGIPSKELRNYRPTFLT